MEYTYRFRKNIAIISLIPFLLMSLLALNCMMWGVFYGQNSLENTIINQTKDLEHCIITNIINSHNILEPVQVKQLPDTAFSGMIASFILITFTFIQWLYKRNQFSEKVDTLVSLCVRMDD